MTLLAGSLPPFMTPTYGMIIWTVVMFLITWLILGKFAFKPIANALKTRENDIQEAMDAAEKAKAEMANLKAENDQIMKAAREERSALLKQAKEEKDNIIKEAKEQAGVEAAKVAEKARLEIENQKKAAVNDLKSQSAAMALEIAEQVIRKELKGNKEQESFVQTLADKIQLN